MLAQVSRWISSGLTSSAPVAVAAWSRSSVSVFESFFSPFFVAAGSDAGCTTGSTSPSRSLPERGDGGGDRPVVADALCGGDEHCGDVAVQPELLIGRVGGGEVVEHDLPIGDEDSPRVELVVADPGLVEMVDLVPQRRQHVVGDLFGRELAEGSSGLRRRDEDRGIGTTDAGLDDLRRVYAGAVGDEHRVADVLHLLDPAAEHRKPGLLVHQPVPPAGGDLGVALVATEHVDAVVLARRELDVHDGGQANLLGRRVNGGGVVAEVGERRSHLVDGRLPGRRAEGHEHRGGGGHAEQHTAQQIRRQPGAEIHRGQGDEEHEQPEEATQRTHGERGKRERRSR